MVQFAVGSSYLLRQVLGSERIGGVQLTVRGSNVGRIEVHTTDWRTNETIEKFPAEFVTAVLDGIKDFAKEKSIDLSCYHIVASNFLLHPVDSNPKCYYQAGRSALRAALEAIKVKDLDN
jgi:hypothetical protein